MSLVERLAVTGGVVKNDRCSMLEKKLQIPSVRR